MYRRLKNNFALRGWQRLPYGIMDTKSGKTAFLDTITFQAASFCDGKMCLDSPLILPLHREALDKLQASGITEDCPPGSSLEFWQKYRLSAGRYAASAHWSITGRCNLRCRHCYMSAPQAKYGELTTAECLRIIDQITEAGIGSVSLTGGEPLIRKDFWQLVDALLEQHIAINRIYTNGLLVTDEFLQQLKNRGISCSFSISFDGCGCHDWMRGIPGTEMAVVNAIRRIRLFGFKVGIETALYSTNLPRMEETYKLLKSLDVYRWKMSPAMNSGNWKQENGNYDILVDELFATYLDLIRIHQSDGAPLDMILGGFYYGKNNCHDYFIPYIKFDGSEKVLRQVVCQGCRVNLHIMADGRLLPCMPMTGSPVEAEMPSLLNSTICEELCSSRFFDTIDTHVDAVFRNNLECAACEYRLRCGGGCRACAMNFSNDFYSVDPYSCYFFKNGYEYKVHEQVALYKQWVKKAKK